MLVTALVTAATLYFIVNIIWLTLTIYDYLARFGRDDTDPASGHSGLLLYTDAKTNVQYVGTVFGGLVRRVTCPDGVAINHDVNKPFAPAKRTGQYFPPKPTGRQYPWVETAQPKPPSK